jgi:hypothetical protein
VLGTRRSTQQRNKQIDPVKANRDVTIPSSLQQFQKKEEDFVLW